MKSEHIAVEAIAGWVNLTGRVMKPKEVVRKLLIFSAFVSATFFAKAASFSTLQNSPLSVPATGISSIAIPGATNLVGTNFLVSAVASGSLHGGHVSISKSVQWSRSYSSGLGGYYNAAYASLVRGDGSLVVTGPSQSAANSYDFATVCYASDGTARWTNRYDGPGHGADTSRYTAGTASGDVWVIGDSMRYATNSTLTDVVTIRYSRDGVPIWTNRYSSFETNGAYPTGLVVDSFGNAYVALWGAYWTGYSGTTVEDCLIKYDIAGNMVWLKRLLSSAPHSNGGLRDIQALVKDASGNIFVAGDAEDPNLGGGTGIEKFGGDGTPLSTNFFPWQLVSLVRSVQLDREENVIFTGEPASTDYVILKCAQDGRIFWTNKLAGPAYDGGDVPQTRIDPWGNTFLIGGSPGASPGLYQVAKYSPDGIPLWTNQNVNFGPTNSMIYDTAADSAGNLYLTGGAPGANGRSDYVTFKCSSAGQLVWTNRLNAAGNSRDIPFALAVDPTGNVLMTGQSTPFYGVQNFWTVKYADSVFYTPPTDFTGIDTLSYTLFDSFGHSATGSVDVAVAPGSFRFHTMPVANTGGVQLQADGFPGTNTLVLEVTSNFWDWQPILTNAPSNGSVQFLDPAATGLSPRFYRARQTQ